LLGALVDRWGYGEWTFPAWTYLQANLLEGAAGLFGSELPFAYLWMLPANIFAPVVLAMLALAIVAWLRCPRHPVTWATLPFFIVHNLLSHKEERFLFPIAILATALVPMALAPSLLSGKGRLWIATWAWNKRSGVLGKFMIASSMLLAFVPLGWHHNVRFARYVHDHLDDELHATVLPDIDLSLPAFHPRVYDLEKLDPEEIGLRLEAKTLSRNTWLVADRPILHTGVPALDSRATLVWSELPLHHDEGMRKRLMRSIDSYNAHRPSVMRPLRFRSLYRLDGPSGE
jgi:phosphatidylinositol glycan class B